MSGETGLRMSRVGILEENRLRRSQIGTSEKIKDLWVLSIGREHIDNTWNFMGLIYSTGRSSDRDYGIEDWCVE